MRRARLIAPFFLIALAAGSLHAQWQVTADAGVARLHQSGIPEADAPTFGVTANTSGDRWDFASSGLAARTAADRWTSQELVGATLRNDPFADRQWNLTAYLSDFAASNDRSTVAGEAMAQTLFGGRSLGVSIGAGGGVYAHDGAASLGRFQVDGWLSKSVDRLLMEASTVATKLTPYAPFASGSQPLTYTDLSASWRREYTGASFGATAGLRAGFQGTARSDEWASADATVWLSSRAALVASVGRTLEDAVRGIPRTRYVSVAVRWSAQPHAAMTLSPHHERAGVRVHVEATAADRRRFTVDGTLPMVSRVELMADFTDWMPVLLEKSGGAWLTEQSVSPGLHRMAIRIDGGEWTTPANLPHETDDLGGVVGLITVP